jgi:hypothetical protein
MSHKRGIKMNSAFRKKVKCFIISGTALLAGIVGFCFASEKKPGTKDVVEKCLQDMLKAKISIECCYMNWWDPTMVATTEESLIKGYHDYKIIVDALNRTPLWKLEPAFKKFKFEAADPKKLFGECRMTFGFFEEKKEILRISFCRDFSIVRINGQIYKNSRELMEALLPILPHEAYKSFYSFVLDTEI